MVPKNVLLLLLALFVVNNVEAIGEELVGDMCMAQQDALDKCIESNACEACEEKIEEGVAVPDIFGEEAMGGQFLEVDYQEDGSGAGGYAKEMSKEWHAAARAMLTKQCAECDIVITTFYASGFAMMQLPGHS